MLPSSTGPLLLLHPDFLLLVVYPAVGGDWFQIWRKLGEPCGGVKGQGRRATRTSNCRPVVGEATGKREEAGDRVKEHAGPRGGGVAGQGPFAIAGLTRPVYSLFTNPTTVDGASTFVAIQWSPTSGRRIASPSSCVGRALDELTHTSRFRSCVFLTKFHIIC